MSAGQGEAAEQDAATIREGLKHTRMRVVNTHEHPSYCEGCKADAAVERLLVRVQELTEARERMRQSALTISAECDRLTTAYARVCDEKAEAHEAIRAYVLAVGRAPGNRDEAEVRAATEALVALLEDAQ